MCGAILIFDFTTRLCITLSRNPTPKAMADTLVRSISNPNSSKVYRPLSHGPSTIRLLRIHKGNPEDPILCSLFESVLDGGSGFDALSYVWGDLDKLAKIQLNAEDFNITQNLEWALRQLRNPSQDRVIWVDALCINQNDFLERNAQVSQMSSIYKLASAVVLWLGLGHEMTEQAVNLIAGARAHEFHPQWFVESIEAKDSRNAFAQILLLFGNVYWNRLWCMVFDHPCSSIKLIMR